MVPLEPGQIKGVADDPVALDVVVDDSEESGPVYDEDAIVEVVPPIPWLIVFVLARGATEDRLVEYNTLG